MVSPTGGVPPLINSMRARRAYQSASQRLNQSLTQLATGLRINRGADDPAGLIAAETLAQTLAVLDAETSANERASLQAATADGALGEVSGLLAQAKSLVSANANSAGLSADERAANQLEIDSILSAVDRVSASTTFGGRKLLDGSATLSASGKSLAIEGSASANLGTTDVAGTTYTLADLKSGKALSTLGENTVAAGAVVDQAISDVATRRASLGAYDKYTLQTRLSGVATAREQLTSAVSLIRDTDYALATAQQSSAKLLQQSSLSALMQSLGRRRRIGAMSLWA